MNALFILFAETGPEIQGAVYLCFEPAARLISNVDFFIRGRRNQHRLTSMLLVHRAQVSARPGGRSFAVPVFRVEPRSAVAENWPFVSP